MSPSTSPSPAYPTHRWHETHRLDRADASCGRASSPLSEMVLTGHFTATPGARTLSAAAHLDGHRLAVVARFVSCSGGATDPGASPENSLLTLAVGFRVEGRRITHLLTHSTDVATHPPWEDMTPDAAPVSFATSAYRAAGTSRLRAPGGQTTTGRYWWTPVAGRRFRSPRDARAASAHDLVEELTARVRWYPVSFVLTLDMHDKPEGTEAPLGPWSTDRLSLELGVLHLTAVTGPDPQVGAALRRGTR